MIEKIISYLAQNFSQQKIAEMVGCTQPYVAQIASHTDYAPLIEAERTRLKLLKRDEEKEKKYEDLEDKVIAQVRESMPFAEFRDLSRTMEVLIRRKQQQAMRPGITVNGNAQFNTVVLSIPQAAVPEITLNSQREVIAIGEKSLAPMQASQVRALFDGIEKKQKQHQLSRDIEFTEPVTVNQVPKDF